MRQARSNFDRKRRSEPSSSFILIPPLCPLWGGGVAPLANDNDNDNDNEKSRIGGRAPNFW